LFVSHNLSAVRNLCQRGFLLDEGRLIRDGAANEIVDYYLGRCLEDSSQGEVDLRGLPRERSSTVSSRIVALRTRDAQGATVSEFGLGEEFNLEIDVENVSAGGFMMAVFIENTEGVRVYHMRSQDVAFDSANKHPNAMVRISIPRLCIVEGQYLITVSLRTSSNALEDTVSRALSFRMRNRETTDRNWPAVIDEKGVWAAVKT
jgi:lipopolysaccharide transport system ATP-binding protein